MPPAFSSPRQAAGFALLLLLTLVSPPLAGKLGLLPPLEQAYASYAWGSGSYPYQQDQIFHQKGDIDILFIGSSHMNSAIDPQYVEDHLSQKLGRPATVISLCWGGAGFDALYFVASDVLQHRKVRMLVFYDDHGKGEPFPLSWRFVRWSDRTEALSDLPWRFQVAYYYGSIIGMPRNLFNRLVPSLPIDLSPGKKIEIAQDEFHPPFKWLGLNSPPAAVPLQTGAKPSDVCVYSPVTKAEFDFSGRSAPFFQVYFAKKLVALAEAHQTRLVCLNIPILTDQKKDVISQGSLWPQVFSSHSALVGIPPTKLFAGMSAEQVSGLYRDWAHLNDKGQAYFTSIVTPAMIQLYEQFNP
jgi:hypothetical protein